MKQWQLEEETGRRFVIEKHGPDQYWPYELKPTGQVMDNPDDWAGVRLVPELQSALKDPGEYYRTASDQGLRDIIVLKGEMYGSSAIVYPALRQAIKVIQAAIDQNKWLISSEETAIANRLRDNSGKSLQMDYWRSVEEASLVMLKEMEKGVITSLPVPKKQRQKLLSYYNNPCRETWEDLMMLPLTPAGDSAIDIYRSMGSEGELPDPYTLLHHWMPVAVKRNLETARKKLHQNRIAMEKTGE